MGKEKQKEKDVSVRHQLITEIENAKEYLKNLTDIYHQEDDEIIKMVKSVADELDLFVQDTEFSEVGHKYPIFSPQKSAHARDIKKIRKYDFRMIEDIKNLEEACKQLETTVIENDETIDPIAELQKIRQYITETRIKYKHRINNLKGVE